MTLDRHGAAGIFLVAAACSPAGPATTAFVTADGAAAAPGDEDAAAPATTAVIEDEAAPPLTFTGDAGQAISCQPGEYVGTYTGIFGGTVPVTGPVTISLVPDSNSVGGEFDLVTNGGTFDATWGLVLGDASANIVVTHATLMGQLDCTSGKFDATSNDAMFTILSVPAGMSTLDFEGTYDPVAETISGPFNTMSMLGNSSGTWKVTLTP